jgi:hypothetical protein
VNARIFCKAVNFFFSKGIVLITTVLTLYIMALFIAASVIDSSNRIVYLSNAGVNFYVLILYLWGCFICRGTATARLVFIRGDAVRFILYSFCVECSSDTDASKASLSFELSRISTLAYEFIKALWLERHASNEEAFNEEAPVVPSRSVEMTPRPSASISTSPIHQTDGVCSGSLSPEGSTSTEGDVERGLTLGVSARTIQATESQLSSKDEQSVGSWTPPEYRAKLTYLLKHPLNIPWYSNSMEPGGSAN